MKKNLFIVMALVLALGAVGCSSKEEPADPPAQEEDATQEEQEDDRTVLEEEVAEVEPEQLIITEGTFIDKVSGFFNLSKTEQNYDGDYELYVVMDSLSANEDGTVMLVSYKGVTGAREDFKVDYLVQNDKVIEQVYLLDDKGETVGTHLNSIITDFVVLSGDVEVGNSWTQVFVLDNESYEAKTTITEVGTDSFTTETVVEGMEAYENGTYIETRTYVLGKGIVSLYHTLPADETTKVSNVVGYAHQ